ncbi:hypothetical protein FQZ97_815180 [compost metagenome]
MEISSLCVTADIIGDQKIAGEVEVFDNIQFLSNPLQCDFIILAVPFDKTITGVL